MMQIEAFTGNGGNYAKIKGVARKPSSLWVKLLAMHIHRKIWAG
jgi:hypothetical protein